MMGVAGIMGQELLGVSPKWFEAGGKEYDIDFLPLLAIEFATLGFLETKRYQGFKTTGSVRLLLKRKETADKLPSSPCQLRMFLPASTTCKLPHIVVAVLLWHYCGMRSECSVS